MKLERFETHWGRVLTIGKSDYTGRSICLFVGPFYWAGVCFNTSEGGRNIHLRDLLCFTGVNWKIRLHRFNGAWMSLFTEPVRWALYKKEQP